MKKIVMNKVIEYLYGGELNIDGLAMVEVYECMDLLRMMLLDDAYLDLETKLLDHLNSFPPLEYLPALVFTMSHEIYPHDQHIMHIILKDPTIKATILNHPEEIRKLPKSIVFLVLKFLDIFKDSASEIDKFRFFKIWIDAWIIMDDQNEDAKWARKIARKKLELIHFRIEDLLGEVKKSKLFNDADIDNAVIEVSRYREKQFDKLVNTLNRIHHFN